MKLLGVEKEARMRLGIFAVAAVVLGAVALGANGPAAGPVQPTDLDKTLAKLQVFPKEDDWNRDISGETVDPNSARLVAGIGASKSLPPDWGTKYALPSQFVNA